MRLIDEAGHGLAQPVVAAGVAVGLVHALLHHRPGAPSGEQKGVVVELVAVLDGGAVHLGRHAAGVDQGQRLERI